MSLWPTIYRYTTLFCIFFLIISSVFLVWRNITPTYWANFVSQTSAFYIVETKVLTFYFRSLISFYFILFLFCYSRFIKFHRNYIQINLSKFYHHHHHLFYVFFGATVIFILFLIKLVNLPKHKSRGRTLPKSSDH